MLSKAKSGRTHKSRWIWAGLVGLILVGIATIGGRWAMDHRREWIWMPMNPKYSLAELEGLTSEEVRAKLGPPSYDPVARFPDWDEEKDGPVYLAYHGALGEACVIRFRNGRVVEVDLRSK